MGDEIACITKETSDPTANNYREKTKIKEGRSSKRSSKLSLRILDSCCTELSALLTKLIQLSQEIREFL